jgi:hypothetical protein
MPNGVGQKSGQSSTLVDWEDDSLSFAAVENIFANSTELQSLDGALQTQSQS